MDQLATLEYSLGELRAVVASLDDAEMDTVSNCEPWTVRRLASHALNNQLLWAGLVTGQELVSVDDTMGAVPIEGDLAPVADEVVESTLALWRSDGVLEAMHSTPFGELPGTVVINFSTVDAILHAWDLSASVGRPIEFSADALPAISGVVEATCNDAARAAGLIRPATELPPDASVTERLVAAAGRSPRADSTGHVAAPAAGHGDVPVHRHRGFDPTMGGRADGHGGRTAGARRHRPRRHREPRRLRVRDRR